MGRYRVEKIKSRKHLLASSARLQELNELRLIRLLTDEEESERESRDRGIKFYVLAKLRGRKGFVSFSQMKDFSQSLHLIFDNTYYEAGTNHQLIYELVQLGFTICLDYNPANSSARFDDRGGD